MNLGEYIYTVGLDDRQFKQGMKGVDSTLKQFGTRTTALGKSLTKNLTLPIAAVGIASLKLAADFEVASRKFAGAFAGAEEAASAAVTNLSDNFGFAASQATQLLAFTGDLLKGFGATSEQALSLAENTNEIAAALAAYNGVPVAQASEAITKALLGERESLKLLGVVIRETDIDQQLLLNGQEDLTGQALLLARAEATLTVATAQSADAINNFADNTDTLAFQTQALIADLKDAGVEIGTILLPIVKEMVGAIREGISQFSGLDDSQKKLIITLAGVVAAAGPAVFAIGKISTALSFLAANPIVLAIAGVAALTVAVVALIEKNKRERLAALTEEFSELAIATGVAEDEMELFVQTTDAVRHALEMGDFGATFESTAEQVQAISESLGITKEQIIRAGLESDNLSDGYKIILEDMLEIEAANQRTFESLAAGLTVQETLLRSVEAQAIAEAQISAELAIQQTLREGIEDQYQSAWSEYRNIIEGTKTELELLDEQIARFEVLSNASDEYNADQAEALSILRARRIEIEVESQAEIDRIRDQDLADRQARLDEYLQSVEDIEEKIRQQSRDTAEQRKQDALDALSAYSNYAGNVGTIFNNLIQLMMAGEEELTEEKKDQIRALYRIQQAAAIAQITVDTAVAIVKGFAVLGPVGGAIAAVILAALGVTNIGLVAATPPPLAAGGVLAAVPGGRIVRVAEAGDDEAVIPLNDGFFDTFKEKVLGANTGVATSPDEGGQPVIVQNILDGRIISQVVIGYVNNNTPGTQINNTALVSA